MARKSKKGIIEVQFNWIFVLITGFIIFLFIISLIISQKKHSDATLSIGLSNTIISTISSKQQLPNSYSQIDISPAVDIEFTCDKSTLLSDFHLQGSESREDLPLEIIFSQKKINTNTLIIWTQDFSLPFIITRFMYITSKDTAYIIYHEDAANHYALQLYDDLPANLTKMYAISAADLANKIKGFKSYKVICFANDNCPNNSPYIMISPNTVNGLYSYGQVDFQQPSSPANWINYLTGAGLYGAIFAGDKDFYSCEMSRAMAQLDMKRILQLNRIEILEPDLAALNYGCVSAMADPKDILTKMEGKTLNDAGLLYNYTMQLETDNKNAEFGNCPQII